MHEVIAQTAQHVQRQLAADCTGHDWWHVDRVRRMALRLAQLEGADPFIVELAALLHDIADWKFHGGDDQAGPAAAKNWLRSQAATADVIERVGAIVAGVSFKGAGVDTPAVSIEAACVQDADRLDAIGAIGVARTFAYGGHRGQPLYDPQLAPSAHATFGEYKQGGGSSINHFYEKLLLLAGRMHTASGRAIAAERHAFLEQFLAQFMREWSGGEPQPADYPAGPREVK